MSYPGLKVGDSSIRYWGAFGSLLCFVSLDSANDGDCARPVFILDSRLRGNDEFERVNGEFERGNDEFECWNDDGNVVMFSPPLSRSCCSYYSNVSTRHSRIGGNPVKIFSWREATWK